MLSLFSHFVLVILVLTLNRQLIAGYTPFIQEHFYKNTSLTFCKEFKNMLRTIYHTGPMFIKKLAGCQLEEQISLNKCLTQQIVHHVKKMSVFMQSPHFIESVSITLRILDAKKLQSFKNRQIVV